MLYRYLNLHFHFQLIFKFTFSFSKKIKHFYPYLFQVCILCFIEELSFNKKEGRGHRSMISCSAEKLTVVDMWKRERKREKTKLTVFLFHLFAINKMMMVDEESKVLYPVTDRVCLLLRHSSVPQGRGISSCNNNDPNR